jgi:RNA polymerase sigma-70 factor (ECF subfamily)
MRFRTRLLLLSIRQELLDRLCGERVGYPPSSRAGVVLPQPVSSSTQPDAASADVSGVERAREDLELVRRYIARDADAREAVVARLECIPRIVSALNARTGGMLRADELEDLAQTVFLLVLERLAEFDGRAPLDAWALGFMRLQFLKAVQGRYRGPRVVDDPWLAGLPAEEGDEPSIDAERVAHLMQRLDRESAQILHMRHVDGLTFEATARALGVPTGTVKSRYFRALRWLERNHRDKLAEAGR